MTENVRAAVILRTLLPVALAAVGAVNSYSAPAIEDPAENLNAALLDDLLLLEDDRLEHVDEAASPAELEQPAGDDRSAARSDWLAPVQFEMRTARETLESRDVSGKASAAQDRAVSKLNALINRVDQACKKCAAQCKKPGDKPGPPKKGAKPGEADSAVAKLTENEQSVDAAALSRLIKDRWGALPQRQRERILQPFSEQFLPEYAEEIEAYFRALAEPRTEPAE